MLGKDAPPDGRLTLLNRLLKCVDKVLTMHNHLNHHIMMRYIDREDTDEKNGLIVVLCDA